MRISDQFAAYFSARLRDLRREKGLTQLDLARACGLKDKTSVSKWETGESVPGFLLLPRISHALGVKLSDLTGHDAKDWRCG